MRVAIYIRVSTEEQVKEGYSISAQKHKLKAFCIAQDWEVAGIYPDEGISAKDMNRPNLQRMLKDIEEGLIDCVLVWRLDRLTRSVSDLYKILEKFEKYNCKFKSATEVFDTTSAMGRMFITIVAAMAQWERENLGERISMGYEEKVRQGKYALNFRPFGYDLVLTKGDLIINEPEAKTVRTIYDLYNKGYSANRICQYLNERNITTRDKNTWNDTHIMRLIKNPLYKGSLKWNDVVYDGAHDPIISSELFDATQRLIEKRRPKHPRIISSNFIFAGKLKCVKCGHAMVGSKTYETNKFGEKVIYNFYRCNKGKTGQCKGSYNVSERRLEQSFLDYITKQDFNFEQAAALGDELLNQESPEENDKLTLELELIKISNRRKKWQYLWADEVMSDDDFRARIAEAEKEEKKYMSNWRSSRIIQLK